MRIANDKGAAPFEKLMRLTRERAARNDLTERLAALTARLRVNYDTRPVTKAEWDWASGDED